MSKIREITIYSQATNTHKTVQSDATVWGDLIKTIEEAIMNPITTVKAIVKENKVTLDDKSAVLPEGPFTLFLLPVKVKSGKVVTKKKVAKKVTKKVTPKKKVVKKAAPKKAVKVASSKKPIRSESLRKEADRLSQILAPILKRCD